MIGRTYLYNEEYIDLGEIGEHECQITAVNLAGPFEPIDVHIKKAVAFVRLGDQPMQPVDVTAKVKDSPEWISRINKSYLGALMKDWDSDPLDDEAS